MEKLSEPPGEATYNILESLNDNRRTATGRYGKPRGESKRGSTRGVLGVFKAMIKGKGLRKLWESDRIGIINVNRRGNLEKEVKR